MRPDVDVLCRRRSSSRDGKAADAIGYLQRAAIARIARRLPSKGDEPAEQSKGRLREKGQHASEIEQNDPLDPARSVEGQHRADEIEAAAEMLKEARDQLRSVRVASLGRTSQLHRVDVPVDGVEQRIDDEDHGEREINETGKCAVQ